MRRVVSAVVVLWAAMYLSGNLVHKQSPLQSPLPPPFTTMAKVMEQRGEMYNSWRTYHLHVGECYTHALNGIIQDSRLADVTSSMIQDDVGIGYGMVDGVTSIHADYVRWLQKKRYPIAVVELEIKHTDLHKWAMMEALVQCSRPSEPWEITAESDPYVAQGL